MLSDRNFIHWFAAWHAHNKLLQVRFMSKPFIIDPRSSIYSQQFEHCQTDLVFLGDPSKVSSGSKPSDSVPNRATSPCFSSESAAPAVATSSAHYVPYSKDLCPTSSFRTMGSDTL